MKHAVAVAVMMTLVPVAWAQAGEPAAPRRSELAEALAAMSAVLDAVARADTAPGDFDAAPERLREALRTGRFEKSDVGLLTRWIFHEKEETVALDLADALRSTDLALAGRDGERWNPALTAMTGLFASALSDAAAHRRRDSKDWPELKALVAAAAPAVAASLSEADPATRAELLLLLAGAAEALRGAERGRAPVESPR